MRAGKHSLRPITGGSTLAAGRFFEQVAEIAYQEIFQHGITSVRVMRRSGTGRERVMRRPFTTEPRKLVRNLVKRVNRSGWLLEKMPCEVK